MSGPKYKETNGEEGLGSMLPFERHSCLPSKDFVIVLKKYYLPYDLL
jgi:hypothetical protein